jgi:hypothetical protein
MPQTLRSDPGDASDPEWRLYSSPTAAESHPIAREDVHPGLFGRKLLGGAFVLEPCLEHGFGMDVVRVETGEVVGYVDMQLTCVELSILDEFENGRAVRSWIAAIAVGEIPGIVVWSVSSAGDGSAARATFFPGDPIRAFFWVPTPSCLRVVLESFCRRVQVWDLAWADAPARRDRFEFRPAQFRERVAPPGDRSFSLFPAIAHVNRTCDGDGTTTLVTASSSLEVDRVRRALDAFLSAHAPPSEPPA